MLCTTFGARLAGDEAWHCPSSTIGCLLQDYFYRSLMRYFRFYEQSNVHSALMPDV